MKVFLFLFLTVSLFASSIETRLYNGYVKIDHDDGMYYGVLLKNQSEDETLSFELGFKKVTIDDMDYSQNETFISLESELSIDSKLKFSYLNIDEEVYGGNLYALSYLRNLDSGMDVGATIGVLDYKINKVYQIDTFIKSFFSESPFYYKAKYIFNSVDDIDKKKYYNSLDVELGFIYSKYQGMISSFIGEKRYAMQDEDCFSWNIGNLHKRGFRSSFAYQMRLDTLVKLDYLYSKMERIDNITSDLNVLNIVISHKF